MSSALEVLDDCLHILCVLAASFVKLGSPPRGIQEQRLKGFTSGWIYMRGQPCRCRSEGRWIAMEKIPIVHETWRLQEKHFVSVFFFEY